MFVNVVAFASHTGGFEHIVMLTKLNTIQIDDFWEAFEDLPPPIANYPRLQDKLAYLRDRLETSADPLL